MKTIHPIAVASVSFLLLALGACSDDVTLTNATIADVASASASLPLPEPGGWTSAVTLRRFDAGRDASPAAHEISDHVGETVTTDLCLAPQDARKPLFGDLTPVSGSDCRFPRFRYKGGVLDAAMVCRNAAGQVLTVTQAGRYTATSVDLTATIVRTGADGKRDGGQQTRTVARHTGACPDENAQG